MPNGFIKAFVPKGDFEMLIKHFNYPCWMPFYHTISDRPLAHIKHLYALKSVSDFEREIDFYGKYFNCISQDDIGSNKSGKPDLFLSFDDGLIEFHEIIAPILLKKGIPATVFLNSSFIDNQDLFFRYKASILIEELKKQNKTISDFYPDGTFDLLKLNYADNALLDTLADAVGVDFKSYLKEQPIYLNTKQIKQLQVQGFQFGSHSKDHPLYEEISLDEQLNQTCNSLKELENKLGFPMNTFSFPFTDFGVSSSFFEALRQRLPQLKTFGTAGLKIDPVESHYHRIPMDDCLGDVEIFFRKNIQRYYLKKTVGKHRYKR